MTTIKIEGMTCQHCVMNVTKALEGIEGTENVKVDLDKGEAAYDEAKPVDMDSIKNAIEKAGYHMGS
ncbi:MAG: heavy-metal-associated domain-containing protein [Deltaproteobacteria bacterium]|nr:heavy-metal-associated domain-containing protein [Deltaproteobacteria bacterium]MBW2053268.1 heavy-metal-associated domain-containing protein [Deltaproteobacteria bacterium]MBW2142429.1 heavy-metal-associated domain-containing protein [Deltaproteobacteria bacterium]MBW2324173.1 heavy-metal-associated domain-containing protein [Deltaproteobacteria bacterium]